MMMTSGEAVKYSGSMDCLAQIMKKEGAKSLFKGAGANILRAIAGAGVLSGYDQLQLIFFGKTYGSGGGQQSSDMIMASSDGGEEYDDEMFGRLCCSEVVPLQDLRYL